MVSPAREMMGLARVLVVRGGALLVLGACAALWPEPLLVPALIGVACIATIGGLYEITVGVAVRRSAPSWALIVVHGAASVLFGMLTAGLTALGWELSMTAVVAWLVLYTWLAFAAAARWRRGAPTKALVACGLVNAGLAVLVNLYPATIFALLYFGAVYAALLGAWQLAMGMTLHRILRSDAPFAPPVTAKPAAAESLR